METTLSLKDKWVVSRAQMNFGVFCDSFVYTPPQFPPAQMHRDWERILQGAYGKYRSIELEAARSSAKSERVTINYPLWMIGKNPNLRISIVSTPSEKAEKFLGKITTRIESDVTYQKIFGQLKPADPKKWTTSSITVKRTIDSPEPSISAIGTMGQAVSKRSDIIVVDDPLDNENTRTPFLRENMIDWFNKALIPTLEPNGLIVLILTCWHEDDLSQYVMKQSGWITMKYPAIREPLKENLDKWLATDDPALTSWPEKYGYPVLQFDNAGEPIIEGGKQKSISFLRDLYNKNVDTFFSQFLLDPYSVRGIMFNVEWLTYYDIRTLDWKKLIIYQGWDLAISLEDRADYTACATVAYDPETKLIYILNIWRGKITPLEQYDAVAKQWNTWNVFSPIRQITIESDAYQKSLSMGLIATTTLPIVGSEARGRKKEDRIGMLSSHFQSKRIHIPDFMRDGEFVEEYKRFPRGSHDDQLDALAKCLEPVLGRISGGKVAWGEVENR